MLPTLKLRLSSTAYDDEEDVGATDDLSSLGSDNEAGSSSAAATTSTADMSSKALSDDSTKLNEIKTLEEKILEFDDVIIPGIKQRIKAVENPGSSKQSSKPNARQSALQLQQDIFEMKVELELARAQRTLLFEELQQKRGN